MILAPPSSGVHVPGDYVMSAISPELIILIALLIALVFGTTIWMFAKRHGIDHRGAVKGTPRHPGRVKDENAADQR